MSFGMIGKTSSLKKTLGLLLTSRSQVHNLLSYTVVLMKPENRVYFQQLGIYLEQHFHKTEKKENSLTLLSQH